MAFDDQAEEESLKDKLTRGGDEPADADRGELDGKLESSPETDSGLGGYGGDRDPAEDMPRVPSAPETQNDPQSHDAAPDNDEKERWPGH